jgi:hypothetical protein
MSDDDKAAAKLRESVNIAAQEEKIQGQDSIWITRCILSTALCFALSKFP